MDGKPDAGQNRPRIILASGSPRRRELMDRLGWDYRVVAPDVDENVAGTPQEMVMALCERKARAVAQALDDGIILAADTLVAIGSMALGKPADEADACRMLRDLSGRQHQVLTGVCLMDAATGALVKRTDVTTVTFKQLPDDEIWDYIRTGEPMDKAGAYGIQGGAGTFVTALHGSFENVMGLPIGILPSMMEELALNARR